MILTCQFGHETNMFHSITNNMTCLSKISERIFEYSTVYYINQNTIVFFCTTMECAAVQDDVKLLIPPTFTTPEVVFCLERKENQCSLVAVML